FRRLDKPRSGVIRHPKLRREAPPIILPPVKSAPLARRGTLSDYAAGAAYPPMRASIRRRAMLA
ncbi:MAG: hypothetical protein LBU43_12175, partial [Candidatus Accumulibacter sp.]|nr:hypothetical protein [Accumulibacter sp.]